jgi:DNA-directed RNA polymerase subunit H (RpoH/RPB5)
MELLTVLMNGRGYSQIQPITTIDFNKKSYGFVTAVYDDPRSSIRRKIACIIVAIGDTFSKKDAMLYIESLTDKVHTIVLAHTLGVYTAVYLTDNISVTTYEHLKYDDICCMKLTHSLVPIYKLMNEMEVKQLERLYGPREKFPKLVSPTDAMVRYLGMQVGDVFSVTEKNCNHDVGYRLVVSCT